MNLRYDMVACYVVRRNAATESWQILQLRRAPGKYLAGMWQQVTGGIEPGETAVAAARRELREESGLSPVDFFQLDVVNIFYIAADDSLFHCPGFCAVVDLSSEVKLSVEHDAFRWIDRSQIDRDVLWPGERAQLAELCREILDDGPAKPYMRVVLK